VLDFVTILEVGLGLTHIEKLAHDIEGYPPVTIANLAISLGCEISTRGKVLEVLRICGWA